MTSHYQKVPTLAEDDPEYVLRVMAIPWWGTLIHRVGAEFQLKYQWHGFNLKNEQITLRHWLFEVRASYESKFGIYPGHWVTGWVRVLGLEIGVGVYYLYKECMLN